jgi:cytochrome c-type biogenesis protein CcmF
MNVTATVGASALLTALAAALFAVAASVLGHHLRRPALLLAARRAILVVAALATLAIGTLAYALLRDDFSIAHVVSVSSRDMLPHMKWAALYSGQPGSLLFWTWLLALLLAAFTAITVPRIPWGSAHAVAASGAILAAFLVPTVFLASPFEVSAFTPADGVGLNPLLVDRAMLIHPPFMLAGLVSTAVPFALGAAALLSGQIDGRWIRSVRHWALLSWLLLSVGNILGAWWAYTTLGWGGFWGWDPVENSAILPLLPMTAFVHSLVVQERRGMLKLWNLALVFAAFALAVFGTFNVRSGLVASVHAFALSEVGPYFLGVLGLTLVASIVLLGWRSGRLRPDHEFESLASRESSLIVNNYLFTIMALVVLGATLFPVFSELVQDARITVSAPFYNDVIGPLLIALLLLIAVGTVLPWRRATNATLVRRFRAPLAVFAGSAVVLAALGMHDRFALAGTSAAIVLLYVTLREFALGARGLHAAGGRSWPAALLGLFERDRRRYGGYLVHLGLGVMAIAVVASNVYQEQVRATIAPGESFAVGRYTLDYEGLRQRDGTANGIDSEVIALITVREGEETVGTLAPGRRFFRNFPQQPMAIVDVDTGLREDLYVFLQGWDDGGVAEINAFVNPLMSWLWIGSAVYVLGGIVVFAPQAAPERLRRPAAAPAATRDAARGA